MPKITVKVDPSLCITAASCVAAAPKFFQIDDDNIAEVIGAGGTGYSQELEVSDDELAAIKDATESCPTSAITVYHS